MFDEGPNFKEGEVVQWIDKSKQEEYDSGPGPFRVVHSRLVEWAPVCICRRRLGNLLGAHLPFCEINIPAEGFAVTVEMSGRLRTFPEEWFELAVGSANLD